MRLLDYLTGLIALIALPFIAWWGVNQSPQSASRLEARLQSGAVQALQAAGIDWARVEMDGQTAILTGAAPSPDAVEAAAMAVLRSNGRGGLVFGGVSQIETRVGQAAAVRPYVWTAEKTDAGGLVLAGHVPSVAVHDALLLEAQAVSRLPVENRMQLAAGVPDGNWQGIARLAISQLAELDAGRAELSGHTLTLRGEAPDDELRARLTGAVRAVAAPFEGVAVLRGEPLWAATRTKEGVVLSGSVPREADRAVLMSAARRAFPGTALDEMAVATGTAGDWISGAAAGLSHLPGFPAGRMTFDPVVGGFTFEGEAPVSTLQFLSEDMARSSGDWLTVIDAGSILPEPAAQPAGAGAADCVSQLNEMLGDAAVSFEPGRAEFRRRDAAALDAFASIARLCDKRGQLNLSVYGDALSEARGAALADFFARAGAQRPRVAANESGTPAAVEGMDTAVPRPLDLTWELSLSERSVQ